MEKEEIHELQQPHTRKTQPMERSMEQEDKCHKQDLHSLHRKG